MAIIRIGLNGNTFTDHMKERITFDREYHMKKKMAEEEFEKAGSSSDESEVSSSAIFPQFWAPQPP